MSTSRRKPAKSQEALKKSAETYLAVPFHQYLGAELVSLDEEQACISFTTSSRLLTPAGTLHAGAMYIGLELANVIACLPHMSTGETAVSINHDVSLLGTVSGEGQEVRITSRVLKRGKNVAFLQSEAHDATGKLLASGKTLKSIVTIPAPSSRTGRNSKL